MLLKHEVLKVRKAADIMQSGHSRFVGDTLYQLGGLKLVDEFFDFIGLYDLSDADLADSNRLHKAIALEFFAVTKGKF